MSYVPEEVSEKLDEVLADFSNLEKKYAKKVKFWKELDDVMHTGVALYGVLSSGTICGKFTSRKRKKSMPKS